MSTEPIPIAQLRVFVREILEEFGADGPPAYDPDEMPEDHLRRYVAEVEVKSRLRLRTEEEPD